MMAFAENEEFELAMDYRRKIEMLQRLGTKRITAMPREVDADVWAFTSNGLYAAAGILVIRGGMMQGARTFTPEEGAGDRGEGILSFLTQYYTAHAFPHELILDEETDDALLAAFARKQTGRGLEITRPSWA